MRNQRKYWHECPKDSLKACSTRFLYVEWKHEYDFTCSSNNDAPSRGVPQEIRFWVNKLRTLSLVGEPCQWGQLTIVETFINFFNFRLKKLSEILVLSSITSQEPEKQHPCVLHYDLPRNWIRKYAYSTRKIENNFPILTPASLIIWPVLTIALLRYGCSFYTYIYSRN